MSYSYAFVANPHVIYDGIFLTILKLYSKKSGLHFVDRVSTSQYQI